MTKIKSTTAAEPTQGLLELPYAPIESVAIRQTLRDNSILGRQTSWIDVRMIEWRSGFNPRIKPEGISEEEWEKELEIEELALDILENGQGTPVEGDMSVDGTKFWPTDGERRTRAVKWLTRNMQEYPKHKNGKDIFLIEVLVNPTGTTEADRIIRSLSSNNNLKYKPIEVGKKCILLKNVFKYTNGEIAKRLGKSRQYVDNMVTLADQPETIQEAITDGKLTATAALALSKNVKDDDEREKMVHDSIDKGESISVAEATKIGKVDYNYSDLYQDVVELYTDDTVSYSLALDRFEEIYNTAIMKGIKANDIATVHDKMIEKLDAAKKEKKLASDTVLYEKEAANDEEEESHKTSSKAKTYRLSTAGDDALDPIDFKKDKEAGEFELNELMKMSDQLIVKLDALPVHMKQHKADWQGFIRLMQRKIETVVEIIKKAPDQR
jgi:ParB-like chromosome segregation protein Spo0J